MIAVCCKCSCPWEVDMNPATACMCLRSSVCICVRVGVRTYLKLVCSSIFFLFIDTIACNFVIDTIACNFGSCAFAYVNAYMRIHTMYAYGPTTHMNVHIDVLDFPLYLCMCPCNCVYVCVMMMMM